MTKVEIDGKTYCVETLIYTIERLIKDVKASAEYHRLVLEQIREEINGLIKYYPYPVVSPYQIKNDAMLMEDEVLQIIDKYIGGDRE